MSEFEQTKQLSFSLWPHSAHCSPKLFFLKVQMKHWTLLAHWVLSKKGQLNDSSACLCDNCLKMFMKPKRFSGPCQISSGSFKLVQEIDFQNEIIFSSFDALLYWLEMFNSIFSHYTQWCQVLELQSCNSSTESRCAWYFFAGLVAKEVLVLTSQKNKWGWRF